MPGQLLMRIQYGPGQLVQPDRDLARQPTVAFCENQQPFDKSLVPLVDTYQLRAKPTQILARLRIIHGDLGQQPLNGKRGSQLV